MRSVKPNNKKSSEIEVDDLLHEIFLRLPFNSIQRFETVCKNWQSLVTDPAFRKLWRKRNLKPSTGLFLRRWGADMIEFIPFSPTKPTIPFSHLNTKLKIIQSCNGLLLCITSVGYFPHVYHVYNPTTDTRHTLQEPWIEGTGYNSYMSLAFDPNKSSHYKVICFNCWGLYVYSSESRSWKTKELTSTMKDFSYYSDSVYWNGAIHWINRFSYFDIEKQMLMKMPKPSDCGEWTEYDYFGESCDCLNYAKLWKPKEGDDWCCSVDVYELKRDYSEWVLRYHVELGDKYSVTSVLSVVHGVEEDDSFLVCKTRWGIVRYNLVSNTSEELPVSSTGFYDFAFQYIESQFDV